MMKKRRREASDAGSVWRQIVRTCFLMDYTQGVRKEAEPERLGLSSRR